jgi:UDP-glucose 4-epimerase
MTFVKRILVTGGAGLIGIEVCRQLAEQGHEVRLFDLGEQILRVKHAIGPDIKMFFGSILDLSSLRTAMSDCEIVIHLAALLGVKRSENERLHCIDINIIGTKNVLDIAVQQRIKKIVFASSSEVYGEPLEIPLTEQSLTQGKTVYAVTKLAGEELCRAYAQIFPINYTILRYFNCYGPYQVAQFVIMKFIRNVMNDKPPIIFGDGEQIRSYTYVSDTAKATIMAALSPQTNGEHINIGNGDFPISLRNLAQMVIRIGGKEGLLLPEYRMDFNDSDRNKEREIYKRYCQAEKAKRLLGWRAEIPLEEGIKRVFESGVIFDRWENLYDEGP